MQEYLSLLGLEANWVPALIGLIGLPLLYASLATEVHRDYAELVRDAKSDTSLTEAEMRSLTNYIERRMQAFELDWWVVGAFGVLLFTIMICGNIEDLCQLPIDQGAAAADAMRHEWGLCSRSFNEKAVRATMAVYGTVFAIFIGFRLIWARVELAKEAKSYYACGFRPDCVSAAEDEARGES